MSLFTHDAFGQFGGQRKSRGRRSKAPRRRLRLEQLENRVLPTVTLATNFVGLNFNDNTVPLEPPDTIAAAGLDHVVETVNSTIAYYNKSTGAQVFKQDLGAFFGPLTGVLSLSDSVVAYDELRNRFVVGVLDFDSVSQSRFDFAVSKSSDPNAGWDLRRYDMNDQIGGFEFADFPRIGWNADAYVVSFNMFLGGTTFNHVDVLAIDKTPAINGIRTVVPGGANHSTMAPATEHGSVAGAPMWLVEEAVPFNTINVAKMTNVLTATPSFTDNNIAVAAYGIPPDAPQLGEGLFATNDSRFLNAASRTVATTTHLVAAQTVGTGGAAHARWYDINIGGSAPALDQFGEVDPGSEIYTYFPSIEINTAGDLGMTYMQSSSDQYVSMYVTGRTAGDAAGTMQTGVLVRAGEGTYLGARGGDFSGITVDPTTGTTFWAANEFARAGSSFWGTWIGSFTVNSSPPSSASSPLPPPPPDGAGAHGDGAHTHGNPPGDSQIAEGHRGDGTGGLGEYGR